jgi:hypothetical protein
VKVTSPFGKLLHSGDIVPSGQFGFTTEDAGNVMACFWIPGSVAGQHASVELKWKIGVNAKDWEGVAKKDKITGLELDLRKLEAQVRGSMTDVEAHLTNICSALGAAPDETPALDCAYEFVFAPLLVVEDHVVASLGGRASFTSGFFHAPRVCFRAGRLCRSARPIS